MQQPNPRTTHSAQGSFRRAVAVFFVPAATSLLVACGSGGTDLDSPRIGGAWSYSASWSGSPTVNCTLTGQNVVIDQTELNTFTGTFSGGQRTCTGSAPVNETRAGNITNGRLVGDSIYFDMNTAGQQWSHRGRVLSTIMGDLTVNGRAGTFTMTDPN